MNFEEYMESVGLDWNDFDKTYELEDIIEQYARMKCEEQKEECAENITHYSAIGEECYSQVMRAKNVCDE